MSEWRESLETEFGSDIFVSGFSGGVVSSGSFVVDFLTGIGGFPLGAVVEIFGEEGSGKTTLALSALKEALLQKRPVLYEDFECTVSDNYLEKLGIDKKQLRDFRVTPTSMEDGWMIIKRFCEKYKEGLILVDSLAAMPPLVDLEKMKEVIGHTQVASMAQVMSRALRQMVNILKQTRNCLVFINQERSKIDTMQRLSGRKTTPGGVAVKFYAALRLQLILRGSIKASEMDILSGRKEDQVVAQKVAVHVVKNKFAPSFRRGIIYIRMDEGLDNWLSALKIGEHLGFVSKGRGGYYRFDEKYSGDSLGGKKVHGLEQARKYLKNNPESGIVFMRDIVNFLSNKLNKRSET